jgi:hypothetical protein
MGFQNTTLGNVLMWFLDVELIDEYIFLSEVSLATLPIADKMFKLYATRIWLSPLMLTY